MSFDKKDLIMNNECLLSICIPTYKRAQLLRKTLNSIYAQNVDHKLFEVCISDDSPDDETKNMIENEFSSIDNLVYQKIPDCGYMNLIEAAKLGKGALLKFQNDYASFKAGSLKRLLNLISENLEQKPILFFGLKSLKNTSEIEKFVNFNDFISNIDYMSTFCSSVALWKDDFDLCNKNKIQVNHAFPHTSYLFNCSNKPSMIVDNYDYFLNQTLTTKGGYNLPEFFVKEYLTLIDDTLYSKSIITKKTREKLEENILKFVGQWYVTTKVESKKYKFKFDDCEKIIKDKCGQSGLNTFNKYSSGGVILKAKMKYYIKKLLKRI